MSWKDLFFPSALRHQIFAGAWAFVFAVPRRTHCAGFPPRIGGEKMGAFCLLITEVAELL